MSRFVQKPSAANRLAGVASTLSHNLVSQGRDFSSPEAAKYVITTEGHNHADDVGASTAFESAQAKVREAYGQQFGGTVLEMSMEAFRSVNTQTGQRINTVDADGIHLTPAQVESGAIAIMAAGDPAAYDRAANTVRNVSQEGYTVMDINPGLASAAADYRYSAEAFDDREVDKNLPFSFVYNTQAARQDEFGEAFYPTVVVTPDQAGLDVSIRVESVLKPYRHDTSGRPVNFNERNLLDAAIDYTVLENDAIKVIPYFIPGDVVNNRSFADTTLLAPRSVTAQGATFLTSALRCGETIGLVGLSQNPGIMATGQLDNTDPLDHLIRLSTIYIKMHSVSLNLTTLLPISVRGLPYTQFQRPVEGRDKDFVLTYDTTDLTITKNTLDVTGVVSPALAYLNAHPDWVVRLSLLVSGKANLERGNISAAAAAPKISGIWIAGADGKYELSDNDTLLAALQAEFTNLEVHCFDVDASRSNVNRRERGLVTREQETKERYTIPLGPPITAQMPTTDTRSGVNLMTPINATRLRNSILAVGQLTAYADMLQNHVLSVERLHPVPDLEGIARHVVRPYFEEVELDLMNYINTMRSADRRADLQAVFVNLIGNIAYRMRRDSGIQIALNSQTGNTGEKHMLQVGTDPVIEQYLMISGDTRTFSIGFDFDIVSTTDLRVKDYIYLAFKRKGVTDADPLTFGCMAWVPELATTLQVSRGGATVKEIMVQPRTRHINFLPVMARIKVVNLAQAAAQRTQMPVTLLA